MKYDMKLFYLSETGVEVTLDGEIDSVVLSIKDGDHKYRTSFSAADAVEICNMFARVSQHSRELNNKS